MKNIDGIVELLIEKDSNFSRLFNDAVEKSGVDVMSKIAGLKVTKNKNCIIKFNRDIQGVEITIGEYNICVCKINEEDLRDVSLFGEDLRFAYIKTREEEGVVEYTYTLIKSGNNFNMLPTILKQGYSRPRCSGPIDLTNEDISTLKGENTLSI